MRPRQACACIALFWLDTQSRNSTSSTSSSSARTCSALLATAAHGGVTAASMLRTPGCRHRMDVDILGLGVRGGGRAPSTGDGHAHSRAVLARNQGRGDPRPCYARDVPSYGLTQSLASSV